MESKRLFNPIQINSTINVNRLHPADKDRDGQIRFKFKILCIALKRHT